jgi:dihydroflavonol-4-reductase
METPHPVAKRVLVTGGSGFLGEHLVRVMVAQWSAGAVRVLARSRSPFLDAMEVEQVAGDVLRPEEVRAAVRGCQTVFHLAGIVSRDPNDSQLMMRVHVDGTRRVIEEAASAGVERVVIASSSGTIAISDRREVRDEDSGYATRIAARWPYYASKIFQEKVALELGEQLGIEVVVVNPSLLLGPGDRRLSSTVDVRRFLRGQLPVVPPGGINFVDVRDAALATLAARTRGRPGHRYLLGGPNWTFAEFFARLARVSRTPPPRVRAPKSLALAGAALAEKLCRAAGWEPPLDRQSVEMGQHYWWLDPAKAVRELGFEVRDPGLTLGDTVRYLRQGLGSPSPLSTGGG